MKGCPNTVDILALKRTAEVTNLNTTDVLAAETNLYTIPFAGCHAQSSQHDLPFLPLKTCLPRPRPP